MKKFTLFFAPVVALSLLASCVDNTPKTFTVTWLNADGVLLKRDENVKEGTLPVYEGKAPTLPSTIEKAYYWDKNDGWTTEIVPVHGNQVYMAKFKEMVCDSLVVIEIPTTVEDDAIFGMTYESDMGIKVDWGDGSPVTIANDSNGEGEITHKYEYPGKYDVRLYTDGDREGKAGITSISSIEKDRHKEFINEVYFGATITHVKPWGFWECVNLTYIQFFNNETFTSIGNDAFNNTDILSVDLPDSLLKIGNHAFEYSSLASITIPDKVTTLNQGVFYDCYNLTSIDLNQVQEIGTRAIGKCPELKNIFIPNSVENITNDAFLDSPNVIFCCERNNVPTGWANGWNYGRPYYMGFKNKHQVGDYEFFETSSGNIITKYSGEESIVKVPSDLDGYEITSIAGRAFEDNNKMTEVEIPSSIKTIDYHAFMNCSNLEKVDIEEGYQLTLSLGNEAFYNCSKLTEAIIPTSVWKMGNNVFTRTPNITIYCKADAKPYAWDSNWNSDKHPCYWGFIEKRTSSSGDYEFVLAKSANAITKYLVDDPTVREITVPNTIDDYPIHEIGVNAFKNNDTITKVDISESITTVSANAFAECDNLKTVNLPTTLSLIGESAFRNCTSLEEVNIPDNVGPLSIGDNAFYYCLKIAHIIIPTSVYEMGSKVFGDDTSWRSVSTVVYCKNENKPERWKDNWSNNAITYWGLKEIYTSPSGDCEIAETTSSTVVTRCLTDDAKEITIPGSVGSYVTVDGIGNHAFYGKSITKVVIPSSIKYVDTYAFADCYSLSEVEGFESVVSIGKSAFQNDSGLKTIKLSSEPLSIGNDAFFESGITYIGGSESEGIIIPENVVSLGESAFDQCRNIKRVVWPKALDFIPYRAFYECENLETVIFADGCKVKKIDGHAFETTKISQINLPDTLTSIYDYAFQSCRLTSIAFPSSVTSIGQCAFRNCSDLKVANLTVFTSPSDIPSASNNSFENCHEELKFHVSSLAMANAFIAKGGWPTDLNKYVYP